MPCTLSHHPDFLDREHRTSDHKRTVPAGRNYPCDFRCHHLILEIPGEVHGEEQVLLDNSNQSIPDDAVSGGQNQPPQ